MALDVGTLYATLSLRDDDFQAALTQARTGMEGVARTSTASASAVQRAAATMQAAHASHARAVLLGTIRSLHIFMMQDRGGENSVYIRERPDQTGNGLRSRGNPLSKECFSDAFNRCRRSVPLPDVGLS